MKIRTRLIGAIAICLVPIWIGFGVIAGVVRALDRAKTLALIEEYTGSINTGISAFFDEAAQLASYLAALQGDMQLEWDDGGAQLFETLVSRNKSAHDAGRVDESGYCYITGVHGNPWQGRRMTENDADPNAAPVSLAGTEYFSTYIEGNRGVAEAFVVEPYIPLGLDYKAIVTGFPVMRDGRCIGAVNVMQTSAELSSLYAELAAGFIARFGRNAQMHLISDSGQLVSSLRYNEREGGYRDALFGTNDIVFSDILGADVLSVFDEALRSGSSVITSRLDGTYCFVSASRIGNTPFTLCFAVPREYMLASTRAIIAVSLILFVVIAFILCFGMAFTTRTILSSIAGMQRALQDIASGAGDLTARIDVKGNDEIAEIAKSFNEFISTLHGMVGNVRTSASSMDKIALTLSGNVTEISGDISDINRDIDNMNFAVEEQSASVTETSATITQIAQNIESLTGQIEDQSSAVTQSSASMQQMASNIGTISENISKAAESFDRLKNSATDGKESISAVQDLVNKLSAQSDTLLEANSVIDNIASQTNLLAMNAAIEAAHAGDAGKGFSVVAEEIRKLAEDSSSQSKTIAAGLKNTIASIKSIASATNLADGAFDSVSAQIGSLTQLVSEIDIAMSEQNEGSRQVLNALRDIENVTVQIRDGAVEMNTGTATILKEAARLSNVSQQVQERSASIAKAAEAISGTVEKIVQNSNSNSDAINVLLNITGKFKL